MAYEDDTENASQIAELEAQLVVLKKMRATGVRSVAHGGTSTTFNSVAELNKAIAQIQKELRARKGESRGARYAYQTTKGL